jgi:hypothetical protein
MAAPSAVPLHRPAHEEVIHAREQAIDHDLIDGPAIGHRLHAQVVADAQAVEAHLVPQQVRQHPA